jgi:creatinine amidohydrolase
MVNRPKSLYLHDLSWPELKEMLPEIKMAIIPVGSTEQHGPNGAFEYDTAGSREFSKLLGLELYPHVLVTPPVLFGVSGHHIHFPGTITLRQSTMVDVLMDVAWSLHQHGIRRLLFANGHGGNGPALGTAVARIKQELGGKVAWATLPYDAAADEIKKHVKSPIWGHACEIETSVMMYLWPQSVKKDALTKGDIPEEVLAHRAKGFPVQEGHYFDETTRNGCLGDARYASPEIGKAIVEAGLKVMVEYCKEFMKD